MFDAKKITNELIEWIKKYFKENGPTSKAVIGISGGKDSSIVAALCVEALGKERVVGVLMPCGYQSDMNYAIELCSILDIKYTIHDIETTVNAEIQQLKKSVKDFGYDELSSVTLINTPARIRMTTLYGISGTVNGRVANTCNYSEDYVGYATKYGDGAGDFSPLSQLTVGEIKAIGRELGLPEKFIEKVPTDGLCGKTDEDNLGFTYDTLDKYIRTGICEDLVIKEKIDTMNRLNLHKLNPMPHYMPSFIGLKYNFD